jgi:hypothetical protein
MPLAAPKTGRTGLDRHLDIHESVVWTGSGHLSYFAMPDPVEKPLWASFWLNTAQKWLFDGRTVPARPFRRTDRPDRPAAPFRQTVPPHRSAGPLWPHRSASPAGQTVPPHRSARPFRPHRFCHVAEGRVSRRDPARRPRRGRFGPLPTRDPRLATPPQVAAGTGPRSRRGLRRSDSRRSRTRRSELSAPASSPRRSHS